MAFQKSLEHKSQGLIRLGLYLLIRCLKMGLLVFQAGGVVFKNAPPPPPPVLQPLDCQINVFENPLL